MEPLSFASRLSPCVIQLMKQYGIEPDPIFVSARVRRALEIHCPCISGRCELFFRISRSVMIGKRTCPKSDGSLRICMLVQNANWMVNPCGRKSCSMASDRARDSSPCSRCHCDGAKTLYIPLHRPRPPIALAISSNVSLCAGS